MKRMKAFLFMECLVLISEFPFFPDHLKAFGRRGGLLPSNRGTKVQAVPELASKQRFDRLDPRRDFL